LARLQEAERLAGGNKNRLKVEVTKAIKEISDKLAKGKNTDIQVYRQNG